MIWLDFFLQELVSAVAILVAFALVGAVAAAAAYRIGRLIGALRRRGVR